MLQAHQTCFRLNVFEITPNTLAVKRAEARVEVTRCAVSLLGFANFIPISAQVMNFKQLIEVFLKLLRCHRKHWRIMLLLFKVLHLLDLV